MMRLTITRKITAAMIGIVVLCIGTMVWLSSQNLQRGFAHYLSEVEAVQLDEMADILREGWRADGNLDGLRHNPQALRALIDRMRPAYRDIGGDDRRRPPRADEPPPRRDDPPPPRQGDPPPRRGDPPPPVEDVPLSLDGRPLRRDDGRPPRAEAPPPREREGRPRPEQGPNERPGSPPDPWGWGRRLSMVDAGGRPLFGPPDPPLYLSRRIEVDGQYIGTLSLAPQRGTVKPSEVSFVRGQIRDMLLLGVGLVLAAAAAALALARHFLRPVQALRDVAQRIREGQFDARVAVMGRDELAALAEHVNAMAAALEQQESQRRRMLADVSHELRTPLTVIRGELEALIDGIRRADMGAIESLHAEVLRLNKLVDDLYQLALADAGDMQYQFAEVSLSELLESLVERYRGRAADAGLTLNAGLLSAGPYVRADADRLQQVFANLLENSIRYTDAGGEIRLSVARGADEARVSIDDSAPAPPAETLPRLFERLYRADPARSRARGGSGLGLAICRALVEAHGGTISAHPSLLGGVRVEVRLPLLR